MKRQRFQYTLRSLLVAMLVASAFLAGRESNAWLVRGRLPSDLNSMRLDVGESMILDCRRPVPQMSCSEPEVCKLTPTSPATIKIAGRAPGSAHITLQFANGDWTSYCVLVEP